MDTSDQHLNCLCRTCLNDVEATSCGTRTRRQKQWLSIFDRIEECGALQIAELLSQAVPQMEMELSDELPKKICGKCLQQLLSAYRFQQICAQSEERMRELVSKRRTDLKMETIEPAKECELGTNETDSCALETSHSSSSRHTLENPSIQQILREVSEHVIKEEAVQSSAADHLQNIDQLLEHCKESQGEFVEFIKNEPIEEDEPNIEYSDGDAIHSTISVMKDELLTIEQVHVIIPAKHRTADAEDKPYACIYCQLKFSKLQQKVSHEKIHERIELQSCDICGKNIAKRNLKQHKLFHEQMYKCDFCERRFKRLTDQRQHTRCHTGGKPFKCKYCERRYVSNSCLLRHLHTHNVH